MGSCGRPPTLAATPRGFQTKVLRRGDRRGDYGERCVPHWKWNMTPRSLPSRRLPSRRGIPQVPACLPPLVEMGNATSHCLGACKPGSTKFPSPRTLSGFCPGVAGSRTERPPFPPAAHPRSSRTRPLLTRSLVNRTQN